MPSTELTPDRPVEMTGLESGSKIITRAELPASSSAFLTPVAMPLVPTALQNTSIGCAICSRSLNDVRGIPFVVAVSNRDSFLSGDVVIDGLYGSDAIRFARHDPANFEVIRKNDGLFGIDTARRQARHTRVSAVALITGVVLWEPNCGDIALYDNLSPATPLPDGLIPATRRFGKVSADGRFGWRPSDVD